MYRLRLAEKKRFTYKFAYLYEQIRKMHELQEGYLVVHRYDVKSYGDLFRLKLRLQRVDAELCRVQREMYRDRALQKRSCKTAEDKDSFEASDDDYRERLEQIKLQKKDNRKKLKVVERCIERDGRLAAAELEMRIQVEDMVDFSDVEKDEVPENPYRVQEDVVATEPILEEGADEIVPDVGEIAEPAVSCVETVGKTVITDIESVVETDIDVMAEKLELGLQDDDIREYGETVRLFSDKDDYMRMSVDEKVRCYLINDKGTDSTFEMVKAYFETIGLDTDFHTVYEEAKLLTDYYEKQKADEFIQLREKQVIRAMELLEIDAGRLAEYSADALSEVFGFGNM